LRPFAPRMPSPPASFDSKARGGAIGAGLYR
jgi:hypothetical protein